MSLTAWFILNKLVLLHCTLYVCTGFKTHPQTENHSAISTADSRVIDSTWRSVIVYLRSANAVMDFEDRCKSILKVPVS